MGRGPSGGATPGRAERCAHRGVRRRACLCQGRPAGSAPAGRRGGAARCAGCGVPSSVPERACVRVRVGSHSGVSRVCAERRQATPALQVAATAQPNLRSRCPRDWRVFAFLCISVRGVAGLRSAPPVCPSGDFSKFTQLCHTGKGSKSFRFYSFSVPRFRLDGAFYPAGHNLIGAVFGLLDTFP